MPDGIATQALEIGPANRGGTHHRRSLLWSLAIPTCIAVLALVAVVGSLTPGAVVGSALDDAILRSIRTAEQMRTLRAFYSDNVVDAAIRSGMQASPSYKDGHGAIPVPTTFVLDVAQAFSNNNMRINLVSPYPWPNHAGRVLDQFETQAWDHLTRNPADPFVWRGEVDGKALLKVAVSDRMDASCVACHNTNPQSPKQDWHVGDVRGLIEVVTPIALVTAGAQHLSWKIIAGIMVAGSLLTVALIWIGLRLIRPLRDLTEIIQRIASGSYMEAVPHLDRGDELGMVARALRSLQEQTRERARAEAKINHMAHHDALTELPNRVLLLQELDRASARAAVGGVRSAVLCLNLDRFKSVNDTLGHPVGDGLLRAAAQRLKNVLRDGDMAARVGGDEFTVLQTDVQHPSDATGLAGRLIEALSKPFTIADHHISIGASIGIAFAPVDGSTAEELLNAADMALYRAKNDGGSSYSLFEPHMDAVMRARRSLEIDLRQALGNGELKLYYQPIVNLRTANVSAFEALLRWDHPTRGMVSPAEFIPVAEETGAITAIGAWVLQTACKDAASWPPGISVAVNLSPIQFKGNQLVADVVAALDSSGLPAERLELEITETVMLHDTDATLATLKRLRALGLLISMDDFGTGYSSLSYLRKFPFDKIKIDQCFVREMSDEQESMAVLRAITGLSASLGISTIAEGVETPEQLHRLRAEGCKEVQGYLFSKPRPITELPHMLASIANHISPECPVSERPPTAPEPPLPALPAAAGP